MSECSLTSSLIVEVPEQAYPIYIGSDLLSNKALLRHHVVSRQVLILTDEHIAPLYLPAIKAALEGLQCEQMIMPAGEEYKTLASAEKIYTFLLEKNYHRDMSIVALGGGVIGDLAGFVASTYQRGVSFVQIPTTLLAQVDASIGGKTALNHPLGKNMIGAFHQPKVVFVDLKTLNTLSDRHYRAGFAEMIKHALIADEAYFDYLEANSEALLSKEPDKLQYAIQRSCEIKASIVSEDEKDRSIRQILNFGHTFGHALEAASGYQLLHGEAVAQGILRALYLSEKECGLVTEIRLRTEALFNKVGLSPIKNMPTDVELKAFMRRDKKTTEEGARFVFLEKLGCAKVLVKGDLGFVRFCSGYKLLIK